jgi:hypothetical protein
MTSYHRTPSKATRDAFEGVLAEWQRLGQTIPCRDGSPWVTAGWTSEDPGEQLAAARACQPCPALQVCRDYGQRHRSEAGVYGGVTDYQRRTEPDPDLVHGSLGTYAHHGCRCEACRKAWSDYDYGRRVPQ